MLVKKHFRAVTALLCALSGTIASNFSTAAPANSTRASSSTTVTPVTSTATTDPTSLAGAVNTAGETIPENVTSSPPHTTMRSGNATIPVTSTANLPTAPATVSCAGIASANSGKQKLITSALNQLKAEGYTRQNCVLIEHKDYSDEGSDAGAVLSLLPENTTILLHGETDRDSIQLLTPINLKSGQHLIGLASKGKYVKLLAPKLFVGISMVQVGSRKFVKNEPLRNTSVIRGIDFAPAWDDSRDSVDPIIYAQCYNGELIVKDNHFTLDRRSAAFLGCYESNKNVALSDSVSLETGEEKSSMRGGPGLLFDSNIVNGLNAKRAEASYHPDEGVFIKTPLVTHLPKKYQPVVQNNQFIGIMKEAIELETGSDAFILSNAAKAASAGVLVEGGFLLKGNTSGNPPLYTLTDNVLETTSWGVKIEKNIHLSMSKNEITSNELFRQNEENSLVTVSEVSAGVSCAACNTWTPSASSDNVDACEGLNNIRGNIHFVNATCSTVIARNGSPATASNALHSVLTVLGLSFMARGF
ncbi:hypothetical protein [Endozoicomonas euniceicola]|uniref:Right handed beta helix domain-containing protein n=1 Tax=Endozoicomonas euniceicola TaxID=1234143 RepID=A0ABY6GY65_9GAMM|nr:hypothetical protein [Endozoicomonas euniceicola]UYM17744.1 hypothetical protein NX720_07495 [Endozoicomonas euniceicola]